MRLSALLQSGGVTAKVTCNVGISGDSSTVLFSTATDEKEFYTTNDSSGIIEIALEGGGICPSSYAFAHGRSDTNYFMRNWDFDGWNGTDWITLKSHRNDETVQGSKVLYKWEISADVTNGQEFTQFRFACRGKNSSGCSHMFVKSLEIYPRR